MDSGDAALAAVAKEAYDVILMDGRMPGMDGATASRLIRAGGPDNAPVLDKAIYIIAVTANASEDDRKFYLHAGMDDFLSKPIDETKLHRALSRVIARQLQRGTALPERVLHSVDELNDMFGMHVASGVNASLAGEIENAPENTSENTSEKASKNPSKNASGRRKQDADDSSIEQMKPLILLDVLEKLTALEQAVADRIATEAGRLIHSMRGSASYLDNSQILQALCLRLEPQADAGNWILIDESMPEIRYLVLNIHENELD